MTVSTLFNTQTYNWTINEVHKSRQMCHLCTMFNVGLAIHQQTHHLVTTLKTRQGQCCVLVGLNLLTSTQTHSATDVRVQCTHQSERPRETHGYTDI